MDFKTMQSGHLADAVRMSIDAGWPHRKDDWADVLDISSGIVGICDDRVVATAIATLFEPVGMVNLIIVDESMRGLGFGRQIVEEIMTTIKPAAWRLISTEDGLGLYRKLGFNKVGEIIQHQGIAQKVVATGSATWGTLEDLPQIKTLDYAVLGIDRHRLYDQSLRHARFAVLRGNAKQSTSITGFAAVHDFGHGKSIGPVIADSLVEAQSLISLILSEHPGQFIRVDTDVRTNLGPWLSRHGLAHVSRYTSMQKGELSESCSLAPNPYALYSQALG